MSHRDQELREAMGELLAARQDLGSHPEPDELAAYHDGDLPPEPERQVPDHLAACRECAGLLLDLEGLADPDFGASDTADIADLTDKGADKEGVWRRLRAEIPAQPRTAPVVPFRRPVPSSPRWLQALAATLLAGVVGLSLWVASLRHTVEELSRPQPNALVLDLYSGTSRAEGSPPPVPSVSQDARLFTVILNPAGHRRYDSYRVEIQRRDGRKAWSDSSLQPNSFGSFSLILSRSTFEPGDYRVRLYGRTAANEEPIEEYAFRVEGGP